MKGIPCWKCDGNMHYFAHFGFYDFYKCGKCKVEKAELAEVKDSNSTRPKSIPSLCCGTENRDYYREERIHDENNER